MIMIQVSPKDSLGTLYNIKSEGDEPDVAWADFGSLLVSIGGTELAQTVRASLASVLQAGAQPAPAPAPTPDPLAAAQAVVQAVFPGAAPVGEQWGNPPVPPMVPSAAVQQGDPGVPVCQHGPKSRVTSKPGAPKPWAFWGCNARSDDPTKCEKEWIR